MVDSTWVCPPPGLIHADRVQHRVPRDYPDRHREDHRMGSGTAAILAGLHGDLLHVDVKKLVRTLPS